MPNYALTGDSQSGYALEPADFATNDVARLLSTIGLLKTALAAKANAADVLFADQDINLGAHSLAASGLASLTETEPAAILTGPNGTLRVSDPDAGLLNSVTSDELSYLHGVTSAIQTQFSTLASAIVGTVAASYPDLNDTVLTLGGTAVTALEAYYGLHGLVSGVQGQLDAKAPLSSPALSGTPTAPTAAPETSTTQLATTEFVGIAAAAAAASRLLVITVPTTIHVQATGNDGTADGTTEHPFLTAQAALDFLAARWLGADVLLQFGEGDWSTESVVIAHPCGSRLSIAGTVGDTISGTSLQSVELDEDSGLYRVTLNVVSVGNAAVGDILVMPAWSTSGADAPNFTLPGAYPVQQVDAIDHRITYGCFNPDLANHTITGTYHCTAYPVKTILPTITLSAGCVLKGLSTGAINSLYLDAGAHCTLGDRIAVYATDPSSYDGLVLRVGSVLRADSGIVLTGVQGLLAEAGASISALAIAASACGVGCELHGARLDAGPISAFGCTPGVRIKNLSYVSATYLSFGGCGYAGADVQSGSRVIVQFQLRAYGTEVVSIPELNTPGSTDEEIFGYMPA